MRDIFHVHTYRCHHAEKIPDEAYICRAIEHEADSITFTDHAPFPGDPFTNRMLYSEFPEYISTLKELKEKYKDRINLKIGLEIEFLPSFMEYYKELHQNKDIDILMLGQHFYEINPGEYSFRYRLLPEQEYSGCLNALIEGMNTGIFQVAAHPDRAFRNMEHHWNERCVQISKEVIATALKNNVVLEQNISSMWMSYYYREEFWKLLDPASKVIVGIDAHSIEDMDLALTRYNTKKVSR